MALRGYFGGIDTLIPSVMPRSREKLELIRSMQAEGRTQQQIADALGYKDRSTIAKIIKRMNE